MQEDRLTLAVDFDGVLHNPDNKKKGYRLGQPIKGAVEAMQKLHNEGAIITIHSVWADTEQRCQAISKWCRYFDIPYDFITNQKPLAKYYVDNHGYKFSSWEQALKDLV